MRQKKHVRPIAVYSSRPSQNSKSPAKTRLYYSLSNEALKQLISQGDDRAWQVLEHRRIVSLMASKHDMGGLTWHPCFLNDDLRLDFRKEDLGRVTMLLRIEKRTTLDAIKRHWEEICTWRSLLSSWQGPWRAGGEGGLFFELHYQQKHGITYQTLARQLNEATVRNIQNDQTKKDDYGFKRSLDLLQMMGLSKPDSQKWCDSIAQSLQAGEKPLSPQEGPITRDHVIGRLKTWRAQNLPWLTEIKPHLPEYPSTSS